MASDWCEQKRFWVPHDSLGEGLIWEEVFVGFFCLVTCVMGSTVVPGSSICASHPFA